MLKPIRLQPALRMKNHIDYPSGKSKTVCVTACLTALGVPFESFQVTGTIYKPNYLSILNRSGLCARSRKSSMPKNATIGACRKAIKKLDEGLVYMVVLHCRGEYHAIIMNHLGETVVDTAPREKDKRKVHTIHAIGRAI